MKRILIVLAIAVSVSSAQTPRVLSVNEAVDLGLRNTEVGTRKFQTPFHTKIQSVLKPCFLTISPQ